MSKPYRLPQEGEQIVLDELQVQLVSPKDHPRISPSELEHIRRGGGLVDMDRDAKARLGAAAPKRSYLGQLLGNRMLLGVFNCLAVDFS